MALDFYSKHRSNGLMEEYGEVNGQEKWLSKINLSDQTKRFYCLF